MAKNLAVFGLIFVAFSVLPAHAATLYLDPSSGSYGAGETFVVNVRLDNERECVNVIDVKVKFPADLIRAKDFSKEDSILALWAEEPVIDNDNGTILFSGGIPAAYCGGVENNFGLSNVLGKIVFENFPETKSNFYAEVAKIEILSESRVLLADGLGSLAELATSGVEVLIQSSAPELLANWETGNSEYDLSGDGKVDAVDFSILLVQWAG